MSSISIHEISYSAGASLRSDVLKPDPARVSASLIQYEDLAALHFGAHIEDQLVAVVSFTPFAEDGVRDLASYHLRGAAIQADFRGRGIGHKLIAAGMEACLRRGASLIWCDGRSTTKTFYERLGFMPVGQEFETSSGLHYRFQRFI